MSVSTSLPNRSLSERGQEPGAQSFRAGAAEERAIGQREVKVSRDQHGVEPLAPVGDSADDLDGGDRLLLQMSQQTVLTLREPLGQLLQSVEPTVIVDETHRVSRD